MNRAMSTATIAAILLVAIVLTSGCAGVRQSVSVGDPDNRKLMNAKYDVTDLRSMTDELRDQVLEISQIAKAPKPPILVILGVDNNTTVHMDTKALTDALRGKLLRSGKVQFVNAARRNSLLKEQDYHKKHVSADSQAAAGKQLGAKYMLTGSMAELKSVSGRQIRISKKEERYYQLTIEITDLQTGLIIAAPEVTRIRKVSKPLIGW